MRFRMMMWRRMVGREFASFIFIPFFLIAGGRSGRVLMNMIVTSVVRFMTVIRSCLPSRLVEMGRMSLQEHQAHRCSRLLAG